MVFNCLHSQEPPPSVPCGIVPTSRRCHIAATSPIRHPTAPIRATSSAPMADGLSVWLVRRLEFLPDSSRNPIIGGNSFKQFLKTFLFATY